MVIILIRVPLKVLGGRLIAPSPRQAPTSQAFNFTSGVGVCYAAQRSRCAVAHSGKRRE